MGGIKVVTDSASDLPPEMAERAGIAVVPLTIRFGDQEYVDQVDLSPQEFWALASSSSELPTTAAPSPGAFEAVFREAANNGFEAVVCITLAAKFSATHQAAVNAASMVKDAITVHVFDSLSCTVSESSLCLRAAEMAAANKPVEEILTALTSLRSRLRIFGLLDTVEYLKKGGRIGAAGAILAAVLSVKPVITIEDGEVLPKSRQRTRSKGLPYLASLVIENAPVEQVAVSHSQAPDIAQFLEFLRPVVNPADVLVTDIGPTIGVHGGPGLIAVSFATVE